MDDLNKKFNLPVSNSTGPDKKVPSKADEEGDFNFVRDNLTNAIEIGQDALNDLADLAKSAQHPRIYEALGLLLERVAKINLDYHDIHNKKRALESGPAPTHYVQNNLNITTDELSKLLDAKKDNTEA